MIEDPFVKEFHGMGADHILDIGTGIDLEGHKVLVLISPVQSTKNDDEKLLCSKAIDVFIGMREDGKTGLKFTLTDEKYSEFFDSFCDDILSSSSQLKDESKGISFIATRYSYWMNFFSRNPQDKLSSFQIKGLIGELLVLRHLAEDKGYEYALNAWIGSDATPQDFVLESSWIEVKTVSRKNKKRISVSSIEQLDSKLDGLLSVVDLEKTSSLNKMGITLNSLVEQIETCLDDLILNDIFWRKLSSVGYCKLSCYDNEFFVFEGCDEYYVGQSFPCLRRSDIKYQQITKASYELDLSGEKLFNSWG